MHVKLAVQIGSLLIVLMTLFITVRRCRTTSGSSVAGNDGITSGQDNIEL